VGKWADLVLWNPALFGVKPELIIKGGMIVGARMGDANASIPTPQPVFYRPMFGAHGGAKYKNCISFTSQCAIDENVAQKLALQKTVLPVKNCRGIGKADMRLNNATLPIEVNPETYEVRVDGEPITSKPAEKLPLAQLYNLF
jgi:urease subunit alpha